ncbi:probable N-acetyltransferase 8B isoform X4 [Spea bombifrons]|nr:probable N-acetyltransferase 8B isoform X4 [Spea bombifrons]
MPDYSIRQYQDSDFEMARYVYGQSVKDLTMVAFHQALRFPHIRLFVVATFLLILVTTGSLLLSSLSLVSAALVLWMCSRDFFHSYVKNTFSADMLDFQKFYMQREGYGFWVAESGGQVVGTVAASTFSLPSGEKHVELKRMSVIKSHRGKGIAKAFCRTIMDFARRGGCAAVVLETSLAQTDAQKLYEGMGFRQTRSFHSPNITARLIGNKMLSYKYSIPAGR